MRLVGLERLLLCQCSIRWLLVAHNQYVGSCSEIGPSQSEVFDGNLELDIGLDASEAFATGIKVPVNLKPVLDQVLTPHDQHILVTSTGGDGPVLGAFDVSRDNGREPFNHVFPVVGSDQVAIVPVVSEHVDLSLPAGSAPEATVDHVAMEPDGIGVVFDEMLKGTVAGSVSRVSHESTPIEAKSSVAIRGDKMTVKIAGKVVEELKLTQLAADEPISTEFVVKEVSVFDKLIAQGYDVKDIKVAGFDGFSFVSTRVGAQMLPMLFDVKEECESGQDECMFDCNEEFGSDDDLYMGTGNTSPFLYAGDMQPYLTMGLYVPVKDKGKDHPVSFEMGVVSPDLQVRPTVVNENPNMEGAVDVSVLKRGPNSPVGAALQVKASDNTAGNRSSKEKSHMTVNCLRKSLRQRREIQRG